MSTLRDFTARYTPTESWIYDRFIAPAVVKMAGDFGMELLADVAQGASVLEVGCGGGHLACHVAERRPDLRWCGLDLSPEQVARAGKRGADKPSLSFVEGNALELPFGDGSYDVVVSVASIKHWPDQARGLAECARVLRPGGLLFVADADRGCRYDEAERFAALWRFPALVRPLVVGFFMTAVAGRSLDLEDARALMKELPLASWEVRRIERMPALAMLGTRADG